MSTPEANQDQEKLTDDLKWIRKVRDNENDNVTPENMNPVSRDETSSEDESSEDLEDEEEEEEEDDVEIDKFCLGFSESSEKDISAEMRKKFKVVEEKLKKQWTEELDDTDLRGDKEFFKGFQKDKYYKETSDSEQDEDIGKEIATADSVQEEEVEDFEELYKELIEDESDGTNEDDDDKPVHETNNASNFMSTVFDSIKVYSKKANLKSNRIQVE